ncbi:ATP-dependent DNA helicase PcrA, partial [Candidatus Woesearchaeota archaeon]|nr:ATP-dependent DNA helicase PcrA [Candidatus Woesearchaeota archaeon]
EKQREAAQTLDGPLLIVAGAGSGKTRALTYRIANLIAQKKAQPWQILAVTFTNKAAHEMARRVEALLGPNGIPFEGHEFAGLSPKNRPLMGTFHSVALRILRTHTALAGRQSGFTIYDTSDTHSVMKRLLKEQRLDEDTLKPHKVLAVISACKQKMISPAQLAAEATLYSQRQLAEIYTLYEKRLQENNALDFDDLLVSAVQLFQNHPAILESFQDRWRYISVDEYQDTNAVQYQFIQQLAKKHRNLCVIGDSDQSIYRFRGADLNNILEFERDYPEARVIALEQNYRSTPVILNAANAVIEKNTRRKSKTMWTTIEGGERIEVHHTENETEEARQVAREIRTLAVAGVPLSQIVVLYRTNAQSRAVEEAFLREGLAYKVVGGLRFYARKEVKDLLAYLRLIHSSFDAESLLRIINVPPRRIGESSLQKLQAFAMNRSLKLAEVLPHLSMVEALSQKPKAALTAFWAMIERWKEAAKTLSASALLRRVMEESGYEAYLKDGT